MTSDPITPLPSRHRLWLGAALLLILAGSIRLVGLGSLDPWIDEIHTFEDSGELLPKLLRWDLSGTTHSPLPFVEVKMVRAIGTRLLGENAAGSLFLLRLPAALYGTAAVVLLYAIGGRLFGWATGFFAALLLALHPYALEWSRDARMYSHWLVTTLLILGLATAAVRSARGEEPPSGDPPDPGAIPLRAGALNWRWWLLGFVFMYAFAASVTAVSTVIAAVLWLAIVAIAEAPRDRRAALNIAGGAALSMGVFVLSWALPGLVRLASKGGSGAAEAADAPPFVATFTRVIWNLTGYPPKPLEWVIGAVAFAGLVLLARRISWRTTLLFVMLSLGAWLTFRTIGRQHFFDARYVIVTILAVCVGAGATAAWLWSRRERWGPAGALVIIAFLAAAWVPGWRSVLTEPKLDGTGAFEPIVRHAKPNEALVIVPDWGIQLGRMYDWGDHVTPLLPPREARTVRAEIDVTSHPVYRGDYEKLVERRPLPPHRPAATWVVVLDPAIRLKQITPILDAYAVPADRRPTIEQMSGAATYTARISDAVVENVVLTQRRSRR